MRLLLTTDTVGGVWTYTKQLTEELLQRGCSVALVSFGAWPSDAQLHWSAQVTEAGQKRFQYVPSRIPLEWMPDNTTIVAQGSALLQSTAKAFKPDLLHSNQFCFGQLSLDFPKLLVAHSDVLSWADSCLPGALAPSPWLTRYVDMVQSGLNGADWVVAPTSCMMLALEKNFLIPGTRSVIANGRTIPASRRRFSRTLQVVTAGRLWDDSKNMTVVEGIRGVPVLVAGEGDSSSASRRQANVHYLGFLQEHDLHELFWRSHLYIAASKYEPFGLAPLEAALCGCAIIANDIPSFREVWGSAALYFTSSGHLQEQVERLSSNVGLLADMQERASAHARRYSAQIMTTNYLDVYTHLLSGQSNHSDRHLSSSTHVH